jgi:hypothetical protein
MAAASSRTTDKPQHTAEEMLEFVTGKIKNMPFVEVDHKLMEKNGNKWYSIKAVNNNLNRIGNGIFHAMTLSTISSDTRVVNIRILFNDSNKELNTEMQANADALIAIFREVSQPREGSMFTNSTIDNIEIKEFEDPRKNKHLAVFANTIRGASLVYTYNLCVNFVREVSSRYGCDATTPSRQGRGKAAMNSDAIEKKKQLLQQQLAELELQQATAAAASDEPATPAAAVTSKPKVPKQYNVQVGNGRRIKIRTPSPQVGAASGSTAAPAAAASDTNTA